MSRKCNHSLNFKGAFHLINRTGGVSETWKTQSHIINSIHRKRRCNSLQILQVKKINHFKRTMNEALYQYCQVGNLIQISILKEEEVSFKSLESINLILNYDMLPRNCKELAILMSQMNIYKLNSINRNKT